MRYGDILLTNLPSMRTDGQTILASILSELQDTAFLNIAVGYASKASLEELDRLIHKHNVRYTMLIVGMYYIEGMPEQMYHVAMNLHRKWAEEGIGEIRIIKRAKYHGKLFVFEHKDGSRNAILGSANLSVLKPDASTRMQYEIATLLKCTDDITAHWDELIANSVGIDTIADMKIISTLSTMLDGDPNCEHLPQKQVDTFLEKIIPEVRFDVEIKCPTEAQLKLDDPPFMGSNINVCYARPRAGEDMRDFYEVQVHLPASLLRENMFPKWHPFFVITDDGYWFKVKNTSGGPLGKQLTAGGAGDRVFGKWLKGRLIAAGLLDEPMGRTESVRYEHAVTKEMLQKYGRDTLTFIKTAVTAPNDEKMSEEEWSEYIEEQKRKLKKRKEEVRKAGKSEEEYLKYKETITCDNWFYSQDELDVWYLSFRR